ncbi:MFS transporter [bacterium]|nr:MFS transporter [bacterium]
MRDFRRLVFARFFFTLGVQMQAVIVGWRMYELTHDALFLGLVGLAEALPAIGLALPAGGIVDRSRPLAVYRWVAAISFFSGAVLVGTHIPGWEVGAETEIVALFAASLLTGLARAFSQPAVYAMVPRLVPRSELSKAMAWTTAAMQTARVAGPALGGLMYGFVGVEPSEVAVCSFLCITLAGLFSMRHPHIPARAPTSESRVEELFSGLKYVFRHPVLLPALSLDMISVLFGGVTAILPVYASEILLVGPKGLGALRAAPAVGAAVMSLWFTRREIKANAGRWLFISVTGFGLCILVFALSESFALSFFALVASGGFDSVSMIIRSTSVQLLSPDSMRGRISSVNSMFIGSSNELGQFESGIAASLLGAVPSVVFGGVMCLLTVAATAYYSPGLRRLHLGQAEALE